MNEVLLSILDGLLSLLLFVVVLVIGFYLLLLGRRKLPLTTAVICLAAVGGLLALIFFDERSGWALIQAREWLYIGIAVAAGIIGGFLGARRKDIATTVIGFFAGGYMGLLLYDIAFYVVVDIANWPEQTAFWVGVAILIIGGLLGIVLTRRSEAVAIILISAFVGVDLVTQVLGLSPESSFTAVITLSLALLGLVVQYAQYLREIKANQDRPFTVVDVGIAPATELFDLSDDH